MFNAKMQGEVALEELGTTVAIGVKPFVGRQLFLDVRGKTLLVSMEWLPPRTNPTQRGEVEAVVRSFRFPR